MRPLVYLGPSLPVAAARRLLDADYRPPVRRGDLPATHVGPVVIIDGDFHQHLSVSPNEILRLLDGGTRVVGASSMGALRASELHPHGMRGCGWVFRAYRSGRIIADDEVAIAYRPDTFAPLTVPLVNVRYWIARLRERALLDGVEAGRLLVRARRIFYADRSEALLLQEWRSLVGSDEVERLLAASDGRIADVKAADAALALVQIRAELRRGA